MRKRGVSAIPKRMFAEDFFAEESDSLDQSRIEEEMRRFNEELGFLGGDALPLPVSSLTA